MAKIIAKLGPSDDERIKNRQAARMARRDQMRQEELDRERELKKEQARLDNMVRPHELAIDKMKELESKFHERQINNNKETESSSSNNRVENDLEQMKSICESKQLQLDEVLALDAIYADLDTLKVSEACRIQELQSKLDSWQMEDGDIIDLQKEIVEHPKIIYTLKRSIEDPQDEDWIIHLLVVAEYSPSYPISTTPPILTIQWYLITKQSLVVPSNKPLVSCGVLDEGGLLSAIAKEAQELEGMPVVYELLDTWLNDHIFDYIQKS
jgi:hypothetical protein